MTLPDPSRVPGAEPLSAVEANLAEIHRLADTGSLWLGMVAAPSAALREGRVQIRSLAREALEALRAERTAAPASGEVSERLEHAIALVIGLSLAAERGQRRAMTNGELDGLLEILNQAEAALASSLTPQQDVEAPPLWQHAVSECNAAHVALDRLGAPKTTRVRRVRGPDGDQDVTIGLADRIAALARVPPAPQPPVFRKLPTAQCPACKCRFDLPDTAEFAGQDHRLAAQARSAGRVDLDQLALDVVRIVLDVVDSGTTMPCKKSLAPVLAALQRARRQVDGPQI